MFLVIGERTSPYFNLAFEEYALTQMNEEMIVLWRNDQSVIVGNNQNTIEEVDIDFIRENRIPVVRRQSGGGAVFHDLGNVNFTIIQYLDCDDFDNYAKFTRPILGYLKELGVRAELQGRNDLVIDGKKFCGNAQAVKRDRIMHHGCILYSTDFSDLARALKPREIKIKSKGVKSVRKRVTNIVDYVNKPLSAEEFFHGLGDYFVRSMSEIKLYSLTKYDIDATERLVHEKYETWEWNFGKSPTYNMENSCRYDFGIVDIKLMIQGGVIVDMAVFGDFFGERDKSELESLLCGVRHERNAIAEVIGKTDVASYIHGMTEELFLNLIC